LNTQKTELLTEKSKISKYENIINRINLLLEGETDQIAALATVICELHNNMSGFHWTGFYRTTAPGILTIGPYQGNHGCLRIPFHRGVCGEAARTKKTLRIADVNKKDDHIACSSSTVSELVVPVFNDKGEVMAVLDIDSDLEDYFDEFDQHFCEKICHELSRFF